MAPATRFKSLKNITTQKRRRITNSGKSWKWQNSSVILTIGVIIKTAVSTTNMMTETQMYLTQNLPKMFN